MIIILVLAALICVPIAGYHSAVGGVAGLLQAATVLILLSKAPGFVKALIARNPLTSDLILTAGTTVGSAALFGPGLVLGIAALTCGLLLSMILPNL